MVELLSESVLIATAGLVGLPLVTRRLRRSFRPGEHVRFNAAATASGLVLLEAALVICALPVAVAVTGVGSSERHFFAGDTVIGWGSGVAAMAGFGLLLYGYLRHRRTETRLRVEAGIGAHYQREDHELVVLDSERPVAYALGGREPQIVVTSGLMALLSDDEVNGVLEHELAHLRFHHRRFLALAGTLAPAARVVPGLRRVLDASRFAVERWADTAISDPAAARRALLKLSDSEPAHGLAAFGAGDVAERISALAEPAPASSAGAFRLLLYLTAFSLVSLSLSALVSYWM
jgi:Zn-dependent protease with chaperone function